MKPKNRASLLGYADGQPHKGKSVEEVFSGIKSANVWSSEESLSGPGSTMGQTKVLRAHLPGILRQFGVRRLLDLPCGDFNWMQHADLDGIHYTGGDIVSGLIERNRERYGRADREFLVLDLMSSDPGNHDLVFCRDCLVHLSFEDIGKALENLKRSDIRLVMTTTFPEEPQNEDIVTGGWRPLNFLLPPFSWPEPLLLLNEGCTEGDGAFADKSLGIWELSDLSH